MYLYVAFFNDTILAKKRCYFSGQSLEPIMKACVICMSHEKHPLSARIICSTCGCTYVLIGSKKKGEKGKKYWRCSSFLEKRGTEIEGRTFTIIRPDRGSTKPYNIKRRKKHKERPMLCTDIRIPAGEPELAFINAWNQLVDKRERYLPEWQRAAMEGVDLLRPYRTTELRCIVEEVGHIETMPYDVMLRVLDHIEIRVDGNTEVILLVGTSINVTI